MQYIGKFTPQANPSGSFNLQYNHGHFIFINESYANLQITGESWSFPLQSGQARMVCINQSSTSISYSTLSTLQIANAVDAVLVEYYAPGEKYLETYPSTLTRQAIVGNVVQTSGGSVANLINDGNPAGTQFIEATATGDASSGISMKNDASIVIGNATHNGSVTFTGTTLYSNQSGVLHQILKAQTSGKPLLLGNGTDNIEVLLNLDVDNNLFIAGKSTFDNGSITTDGSGNVNKSTSIKTGKILSNSNGTDVFDVTGFDTNVSSSGAGNIIHMQYGGTDALTIGSSGITMVHGGFNGLSGDQLSRLGNSSGTGSGTFNHNLGATPDFVAITTHVNGSQTVGYFNETSTQISVVTGAGLAWFALLTKRS